MFTSFSHIDKNNNAKMTVVFKNDFFSILCITILLAIRSTAHCKYISGIYVDNGLDQTIIHKSITRREKRDISRDVMNFLDLPARPRRSVKDSSRMKGSFAQYIQDIYRISSDQKIAGGFNFVKRNLEIIERSDVIVSYATSRNSSMNGLWFDLSETPRIDRVIGADLHLYVRTAPREACTLVLLDCAQTSENRQRLKYVGSTNVSADFEGWIQMDVTDSMHHQLKRSNRYLRLHVSVVRAHKHTFVEEGGIVSMSNSQPHIQPFLVGYFERYDMANKRTAVAGAASGRWRRSSPAAGQGGRGGRGGAAGLGPRASSPCRAHTLYVRFRELEFDELIVAPEGYDAQYCAGECRFPLTGHMNASNHAIVQTLLHLLRPGAAPASCCAPQALASLPVLYSREPDSHVYMRYRDMIVNSCGCH